MAKWKSRGLEEEVARDEILKSASSGRSIVGLKNPVRAKEAKTCLSRSRESFASAVRQDRHSTMGDFICHENQLRSIINRRCRKLNPETLIEVSPSSLSRLFHILRIEIISIHFRTSLPGASSSLTVQLRSSDGSARSCATATEFVTSAGAITPASVQRRGNRQRINSHAGRAAPGAV